MGIRSVFPGRVVLHSWGGGTAYAAFSEAVDGRCVTKINHFYNGLPKYRPPPATKRATAAKAIQGCYFQSVYLYPKGPK